MSKTDTGLPDTPLYLRFKFRNFPITRINYTYNIQKERRKLGNLIANEHKHPELDTTGQFDKW